MVQELASAILPQVASHQIFSALLFVLLFANIPRPHKSDWLYILVIIPQSSFIPVTHWTLRSALGKGLESLSALEGAEPALPL